MEIADGIYRLGFVESFYKSERWTCAVFENDKTIHLCGRKHHSETAALKCAHEMVLILKAKSRVGV